MPANKVPQLRFTILDRDGSARGALEFPPQECEPARGDPKAQLRLFSRNWESPQIDWSHSRLWTIPPRVRTHSQNKTVAARAMAERKTLGQRSYRVATRRQSLSLPNMVSIRLRRLYRRLSYFTVFLRCF